MVTGATAADPGDGTALEQCISSAQANAFTCRDAALDVTAPGFAACAATNVASIKACPPA